jgi:hypothetical protein
MFFRITENTPAFTGNAGVFFSSAKHGAFWAVFGWAPKKWGVLGVFFIRKYLKTLILVALGSLGGVLRGSV